MTAERMMEILAMPRENRPTLKRTYIPNHVHVEAIREFSQDDEWVWSNDYEDNEVVRKTISKYLASIGVRDPRWKTIVSSYTSDMWEEYSLDAVDIIRGQA